MTTDTRKLAERAGATVLPVPLHAPDDMRITFYTEAQLDEFARLVREEAIKEAMSVEIYIDPSVMPNLQRRWHAEGMDSMRRAIRALSAGGSDGR
jgi:hypothetical protein